MHPCRICWSRLSSFRVDSPYLSDGDKIQREAKERCGYAAQ